MAESNIQLIYECDEFVRDKGMKYIFINIKGEEEKPPLLRIAKRYYKKKCSGNFWLNHAWLLTCESNEADFSVRHSMTIRAIFVSVRC